MPESYTNTNDYDFNLPSELIATRPLSERSASRLLVLKREDISSKHDYFSNLENYLNPGDILVINNTKVMKARIYAKKITGSRVEILLVRSLESGNWLVLLNGKGPFLPGQKLVLDNNFIYIISKNPEEAGTYEISCSQDLGAYAQVSGEMPLPPYFNRKADSQDNIRYQTIFAEDKNLGAVAAPTAGLHFSQEHILKLKNLGVNFAEITLHVGPGTFLPLRTQNIHEHKMHAEFFSMSEETALILNKAKNSKKRIIVVGSTALRVVEQVMLWAQEKNSQEFFACSGKTNLYIKPGFKILGCDALITNFHIPKSTLFILVCSLIGRERALLAYSQAIENNYRFYSYGDACYFEINI